MSYKKLVKYRDNVNDMKASFIENALNIVNDYIVEDSPVDNDVFWIAFASVWGAYLAQGCIQELHVLSVIFSFPDRETTLEEWHRQDDAVEEYKKIKKLSSGVQKLIKKHRTQPLSTCA